MSGEPVAEVTWSSPPSASDPTYEDEEQDQDWAIASIWEVVE